MLRRHLFYVSLLLGGGWPGENLLLRCGDFHYWCSWGAGMSGEGSLADFGRSFREGDPRRILPAGVRCRSEDNSPRRNVWILYYIKAENPPNLKTTAGAVFSEGNPPPRKRDTYQPCIHVSNYTYEYDIKNIYISIFWNYQQASPISWDYPFKNTTVSFKLTAKLSIQ
jgi:hypothetical protein